MTIYKSDYSKVFKEVCSQVAPEVNELYEFFRKNQNLQEESDVERQLEVLVSKKLISNTYLADLSLIVNYYLRGMTAIYQSSLKGYKNQIRFFLKTKPN